MQINAKPTKIISGLEPERTRYLLQIFTVVATTKCLTPRANTDSYAPETPVQCEVEEPRNEEAKESIGFQKEMKKRMSRQKLTTIIQQKASAMIIYL